MVLHTGVKVYKRCSQHTSGRIHCLANVIVYEAIVTGRKSRIFGYMSSGDKVCEKETKLDTKLSHKGSVPGHLMAYIIN
jgi:hypothetical protein